MGIYTEIQDRYGKIPESVNNLFDYARLRKLAEAMQIVSVDKTNNGFAVKLSENAHVSPEKLMQVLTGHEGSAFSANGILRVVVDADNLIDAARQVLEEIRAN